LGEGRDGDRTEGRPPRKAAATQTSSRQDAGATRKSDGGDEAGFGRGEAIGHTWSVEGVAGVAVFVEENDAASAFASASEELDTGLRGAHGIGAGRTKEIADSFGENDFHDGFAEAGGRDCTGFGIGVAAAADEWRIADSSGKFAAGAAGGGGGEEATLVIEGDSADGALLVAAVMFGGVRILAAARPGFAFSGRDQVFGIAERYAAVVNELFGAFGDEHHMRTFFKDGARGLDGIFDAAKTGDGTGAKCGGVHDNGVAFDVAIDIKVRAVAGVEDGIVFEDSDCSFDGVECVAPVAEDGTAGLERAKAAGFAGFHGVVGDVPGTAVYDERRTHGKRIAEQ
jgi:hypothetical protein